MSNVWHVVLAVWFTTTAQQADGEQTVPQR
jgi:hypothetical protein